MKRIIRQRPAPAAQATLLLSSAAVSARWLSTDERIRALASGSAMDATLSDLLATAYDEGAEDTIADSDIEELRGEFSAQLLAIVDVLDLALLALKEKRLTPARFRDRITDIRKVVFTMQDEDVDIDDAELRAEVQVSQYTLP